MYIDVRPGVCNFCGVLKGTDVCLWVSWLSAGMWMREFGFE